jgi:cytochrome b6-f complex iron-sulfur subunit
MAVDEQTVAKPKRVPAKRARELAAATAAAPAAPATGHAGAPVVPAETEEQGVSRREFLNYAWLATLGIFTLQLGGIGYHFALPRFKAGEFGGTFDIPVADVPNATSDPLANHRGKFWLINSDQGIVALYKVCTHLGCIYDWKPTENRFICPCHGSTFERNGTFVLGPAPRGLDRFVITVRDQAGNVLAQSDASGTPIPLPSGAASVAVDTGKVVQGPRHA